MKWFFGGAKEDWVWWCGGVVKESIIIFKKVVPVPVYFHDYTIAKIAQIKSSHQI